MTRPAATAVLATEADLDAATAALARAFADDPVQRWTFAAAPDVEAAIADLLGFFIRPYFERGHLYVVSSPGVPVAGAALWAPPDRHALGAEHIEPLQALIAGHGGADTVARFLDLARVTEHFPEVPHCYLGVLGVDPAAQGRGLGAALVAPMLRLADEGGFLCHLESSNTRNLSFYRRLGFREVDALALGQGDGPALPIMQRDPVID